MTTSPRGVAWVTIVMVVIVLFAHAGGIVGESWCVKVAEIDASMAPAVTRFCARHGLWLLLVPAGWFTVAMVLVRRAVRPTWLSLWLALAAALILILAVIGMSAAIVAMYNPSPMI